jgi:hypothetical protein
VSAADAQAPICERCGKSGAVQMGERTLCQDCYFACNSCCGEFGGDDRTHGEEDPSSDARKSEE